MVARLGADKPAYGAGASAANRQTGRHQPQRLCRCRRRRRTQYPSSVVDDVLIGRHCGYRLDESGARELAGRQGGKCRAGERTLVGCGCEFRDPIEILVCVGPPRPRRSARHCLATRNATRRVAADLLPHLIKAVPYKIHPVLTDNGTHFTDPNGENWSAAERMLECDEPFWASPGAYATRSGGEGISCIGSHPTVAMRPRRSIKAPHARYPPPTGSRCHPRRTAGAPRRRECP